VQVVVGLGVRSAVGIVFAVAAAVWTSPREVDTGAMRPRLMVAG
jgi:hypothetical protein